jgi:hypothetical protein
MQIKSIKVDKWYNTSHGIGKCIRVGGTHPPSVMLVITHPIPRGNVLLSPRNIFAEVEEPKDG